MKLSFNVLRPIIFVLCGLGYLPLQSADQSSSREISSIESIEKNSKDSAKATSKENNLNKNLN